MHITAMLRLALCPTDDSARRKADEMELKTFSHELEKRYYSQQWPTDAKPYLHLEPYLSCWFDPDAVFRGKTVLDIGAGECTYTRLIADRFEPKEIVACDLFRERLLPASRVNRNLKLKFVTGDCFKLPFRSGQFDLVWGSGVLSQLPNLNQAVQEIGRVLKSGGLYIGSEPNFLNAVIAYRYFFQSHSANQYLFWPWRIHPVFTEAKFEVTIHYFYSKFPSIRSRLLGTCMGIMAKGSV